MTLIDLKNFVQQRRIVSLREISMHFRSDESAIEAMMERWIQKGVIRKVKMEEGKCGSCDICASGIKLHYEWMGPKIVTFQKKIIN